MTIDWHERFSQQANWTKRVRDYLLDDLNLSQDASVLEIGCGTGVILADLISRYKLKSGIGVDVNLNRSIIATRNYCNIKIINADAECLPFSTSAFDVVFCHYLILWLAEPRNTILEAFRVLKQGGYFLAFAEPDYEHRVDAPAQLCKLGKLQTISLELQKANPGAGKDLANIVAASGFQLVKFGVPGYEHPEPGLPPWWESEWQVIQHDLADLISPDELIQYKNIDRQSWISGTRVLWVPTYYTMGRKP